MFRRACLALVLLTGALVTVLSPGPAQAVADSRAEWASVATAVPTSRGDENPPAAPNPGPPADTSRQSSLPDTGCPSWVFAAVGAALMLAGTTLTMKARRGNRKRG